MSVSPFSRRTIVLGAVLGALSLLAGVAAAIFGSGSTNVASYEADSFSSSAIGHRALAELIELSGRRVVRSRGRSADKAGSGLLLLLEPKEEIAYDDVGDRIVEMLDAVDHCLVVLPKWGARQDSERPGWIESVEPVPLPVVERICRSAGGSGSVVRVDDPGLSWRIEGFGAMPALARPQLVSSAVGEGLIGAGEGALLVRLRGRQGAEHWILSDPDLLSNHGIGRGGNAEIVLEILDRMAPGNAPVVIDETLHGFAVAPSIVSELGRFPLVLVLLQSILAIGVLLWAGAIRSCRARLDGSSLRPGKAQLIENTAGLLLHGGHAVSVVKRYLNLSERRVASALHLPATLSTVERRDRLCRIGRARGIEIGIDEIAQEIASTRAAPGIEDRALRAACEVQQWSKEMLDGDD